MTEEPSKSWVRPAGVATAIAIAAYAASMTVNKSRVVDLFWQIRTGQLIVRSHSAPHFDMFSWTRPHTPWVVHEWLTFTLYWELYRRGGYGAIWLLSATLMAAALILHYAIACRETAQAIQSKRPAPITALLLTCFGALVASPLMQPRPQLFTYLFSVLVLGMVLAVRRGAPSRRLWALVPLFVLWANLHAGVLIGVGLVAAFGIGDGIVLIAGSRRSQPDPVAAPDGHPDPRVCTRLIVVAAAGLAATLITPYGYHEYENFYATITNTTMLNLVHEWTSPNYHEPWGQIFEAMLAVVLFGVFGTRLRHNATELLVLCLLTHEALTALRNIPLFALLGTILIARHVESAILRVTGAESTPPRSPFGASPPLPVLLGVCVILCVAAVARFDAILHDLTPVSGTAGMDEPTEPGLVERIGEAAIDYHSFPARACAFIEHEPIPREMHFYNNYGDGGFLIWKMQDHPVYVDSRADVYFGSLLGNVSRMTGSPYDWRTIMDRAGIDLIMVSAAEPQARLYLSAPDWALVYADSPNLDNADYYYRNDELIFIRRTPANQGLIDRCRHDCPLFAGGRLRAYREYSALR
ncbi:MAG: hypothetical protein ACLQVD_07160 [Capsulimonadaceae bacterium]